MLSLVKIEKKVIDDYKKCLNLCCLTIIFEFYIELSIIKRNGSFRYHKNKELKYSKFNGLLESKIKDLEIL